MFRQILDILGIGRRATSGQPTLAVSWNGDDALRVQTRDKAMHSTLHALAQNTGGGIGGLFTKHWQLPLDAFAHLQSLPAALKISPEHSKSLKRYALSGALGWDQGTHAPDDFGIRLYPFQEAATAYLLRAKRCVLGDEAGVGKTFATIAAACKVVTAA
jgi:SNF2 family DNA or RNA helicase